MYKATINGKEYLLPACWNNLKAKDLMHLIRLYMAGLTIPAIKLEMVNYFLGLRVEMKESIIREGQEVFLVKSKDQGEIFMRPQDYRLLSKAFDWLFISRNGKEYIDSQLTNQLLPDFRVKATWYFGPKEKLFNLRWNEFMQTDSYYDQYNETRDEHQLDCLIASIYRRKAPGYRAGEREDIREDFKDFAVEKNARKISTLSPARKFAVYLFWTGCKLYLRQTFDLVFQASASGDKSRGYLSLNDMLSKEYNDSPDDVRNYYLYDVLERLQNSRQQQKELEAQLKKGKKK